MDKNQIKRAVKKGYDGTMSALRLFFSRIKRLFIGGGTQGGEEKIESPSRLVWQSFFRRKTAVVALSVLCGLFAFVFIAPLFVPLDINYTDPLQQNVSPIYSLRRIPRALKREIADIDGFSDFTVGLSQSGKVYVWGNSKDALSGRDMKEIPDSLSEGVSLIAAGKDHALAVTSSGKLVGWGDQSCGQYGGVEGLNILPMPKQFLEESLSVASISCGYQASALIDGEGRGYVWGNLNTVRNLQKLSKSLEGKKTSQIVFTNSSAIALLEDGTLDMGGETLFLSCISSKNGRQNSLNAYLVGRKVENIASNNKCIALLLEGGELVVAGAFENEEDVLPTLLEGEYFTSIQGGTRHFVGVTNQNNIYAWGDNAYGQSNVQGAQGERVFAGALQTYIVNGEGKLTKSVGLKGYLMGTDGRGRDVFARIVHGGKMTMTIGAVAVLVSLFIGVLVGCTAGYFGGWVDLLLMRVTEIFASLPFLPFAMLLSLIIKNYNISEGMRIFIIMLILGALSWTGLARMIRGQVLSEREKEFVTAARAMGVKEGKIAFRHVLPNVVSVILVSATLDFAGCLLTESSLSYLGFGVQPPQPTWGNMLSGSNNSVVIQNYWWQWLFPALFLSVAVICINVIGDALRDSMDPKEKGE
ncbi:MAG: ABC transporter permease subunit [Clostridia bacterium]|nr:ABC transporter permease subunit [Clostridia bacterium]